MQTHNLGYPRIGSDSGLKKAFTEMVAAAKQLRQSLKEPVIS